MTTTIRLNSMTDYEALRKRDTRKIVPGRCVGPLVEYPPRISWPTEAGEKPSKFHAVICEADGIKFRSKKERARYLELCALKTVGECWFLRQVPFYLPGNTKYVCDFVIFWKNNKVTFEDTKGHRTPAFIRSKKQVEALYPVKIEEGK